jgi:hypothetical protein
MRCSAAACCLNLVSTVTVEDCRFGYGPVAPSHMVRCGSSRGPAGLAWLSGTQRVLLAGSAYQRCPSNDWAEPAAFGRCPQPWSPSADRALPCRVCQCARWGSYVPGVSGCFELRARATIQLAAASGRVEPTPGGPGPIPANQPFCVPMCPGCRWPATSRTCPGDPPVGPVRVRPVDRQSRVSTPNAQSVLQHAQSVPRARQRLA